VTTGSLELPLHWEAHGEAGPPVLLLHGFGTNGHTWNHWVGPLARRHRVLVVEMKGFGDAPKPRDGAYAPTDQAALLYNFILQKRLDRLTLVGHSLGGTVVLLTALRLMEEDRVRLSRLVVVAGAAYPQPISPFIRLAGTPILGPLALRLLPSRFVVRKALRLAYRRPEDVRETRVEAYAEPLRQPGGQYALSRTARGLRIPEPEEIMAGYARLRVPTLLLWGDQDPIVPLWVGERLSRDLPDARLEILDECGHMPQEEHPRNSLEKVLAFLEG